MAPIRDHLNHLVRDIQAWPWTAQWLLLFSLGFYVCVTFYPALFSGGGDFHLVYDAASRLVAGHPETVYADFFAFKPGGDSLFYMYPPVVAMLYWPLALLPYKYAWTLFQIISHLCVFLTAALWLRERPLQKDQALAVMPLLFLFFPLSYALQLGQSEPLILLAFGGTLVLFDRRKVAAGSLLLACCIFLKLFLGLYLVELLIAKRHKALTACLLWLGVLTVISLCLFPPALQAAYWKTALAPIGIEAFWDNHSITGVTARLLTVNAYTRGLVHAPGAAAAIAKLIAAALLVVYGIVSFRLHREKRPEQALTLCFVTMMLTAPHIDTHHFSLLLVPLLEWLRRERLPLPTLAACAFLAFYHPLNAMPLIARVRAEWWMSGMSNLIISVPFVVLLLWWVSLQCVEKKTRRAAVKVSS